LDKSFCIKKDLQLKEPTLGWKLQNYSDPIWFRHFKLGSFQLYYFRCDFTKEN